MSGNAKKPSRRSPEPAMGPDEEGEVPLRPDQIPASDSGAWVKTRTKTTRGTKKPRPDEGRGS
jgi:hypothetical protein